MKKIAVFLAEGFEEIEALTVVDYLRRAKADVVTLAVPVGRSGLPGTNGNGNIVIGAHGIGVVADEALAVYCASLHGTLPDAVFCPGGMPGAANIAACDIAVELIKSCADAGKLITAICAAPVVVLAKTGILAGHTYTCYPGMEEGLSKYCGNSEKMCKLMEGSCLKRGVPVVTDRTLLTGRAPGAAEQFAMEFVRILFGAEAALAIHGGSCQR
jgi:protein deglycase